MVCVVRCVWVVELVIRVKFANFAAPSRRGHRLPPFYLHEYQMIDRQLLSDTVSEALKMTDAFIVDIRVSADNGITVEIDSPTGVDIDTCVNVTRAIESKFDRDAEDYDLEVGSAGLTSPFKVKEQYDKNVGNRIEVLTRDGRKLRGELVEVGDRREDGSFKFTILVPEKVKVEGKKRPELVEKPCELDTTMVKSACYLIEFK